MCRLYFINNYNFVYKEKVFIKVFYRDMFET